MSSFGHAFYCQKVLDFDLDCERVATLSQKQRKIINDGIQEVNFEDQATRVCLKAAGADVTKESKEWKLPKFLKTFATILCFLPMITYGIIGTQTQKASTEFELAEASEMINKTNPDLIMSYLDSRCGP
eukprot:3219042-Karenia_brevis.AAC.1